MPAGPSRLRAVFADGAVRLFDLNPYTTSPYFAPLADDAYLALVRVIDGMVAWPDGQDFDRGTIYALGVEPAGRAAALARPGQRAA